MNERVSNVIHHGAFVPVMTGVSAFAAGIGVGYFLGRRKMEKIEEVTVTEDYIRSMEIDVDEAFESMKSKMEEPIFGDTVVVEKEDIQIPPKVVIPAERIEQVEGFISDILTPKDDETVVEEAVVIARNVFAANDDDWDYEEETKNRSEKAPYVLHKDEFYAEENADKGYSQVTLTYYAGDDILVDEDDSPIYNHGAIVGAMRFGHGSGDPNVFYVRNDVRNAEYEIVVDPGLYSREVLGIEIENNERAKDIKHSHSPRKFRPD